MGQRKAINLNCEMWSRLPISSYISRDRDVFFSTWQTLHSLQTDACLSDLMGYNLFSVGS